MYQIGDRVIYGSEGVCRITDIAEKKFRDKKLLYYVLKPVYRENATVFVPVNNETLTAKMRRVLSPEEIDAVIEGMAYKKNIWIEDNNERKNYFKEILVRGDRKELVSMIQTIYLHKKVLKEHGRKLNLSDEHFFKEAEKMLYDEFAAVLGLEPDQVLPYIIERLEG